MITIFFNIPVQWATYHDLGLSSSKQQGVLYAGVFALATLGLPVTQNHSMYQSVRCGYSMSTSASMAVFNHALSLPVASTLKSTTGERIGLRLRFY